MSRIPDGTALRTRLAGLRDARAPDAAQRAALRDWQARSRALPRAGSPATIRVIHHFACTGGTVICKALAAMPNVTLLSELDPLSPMALPQPGSEEPTPFRPHDPLYHARAALRPPSEEVQAEAFAAAVAALHAGLTREGRHLCIRGHAHSQFCVARDWRARPGLSEILARAAPLREVVTVRHPLASFVALRGHGWIDYSPDTVEAYAERYMAFLDAHEGVPVVQYESFARDPEPVLARLCAALGLTHVPGAAAYLGTIRMSGDSGRRSAEIAPRPPRPVPPEIAAEARASTALRRLCARLGYAPEEASGGPEP